MTAVETWWGWRGLRLVGLAALGISLLLGGTLVWQLGPREAMAEARGALEEQGLMGGRARLWLETQRLKIRSPEADARRAVRSGDKRLLAMATVGPFLPGLEKADFETYRREFDIRFLAAGCVVESDAEEAFREAAYEYAKRYNAVVVQATRQ